MIAQEKSNIVMNTPRGGGTLAPMGFGCASVWGKDLISDQQAKELFERAYELGIRYFDTGHSYGKAEERIGRILRTSKIVDREKIFISTKFGTRYKNGKLVHDVSPAWIEESVKTSLARMKINYIDCLLCHGVGINDFTDEFFEKLEELKKRGLVRAVGANTFDTKVIEWIRDTKCLDYVMLDYNILRQDREPMIKELHEQGIGIIAGSALGESLWSNRIFKIRGKKDIWYLVRALVKFRRELSKGRKFRFINNIDGVTGAQVALRYVLNNPYIAAAVFGATSLEHLEENVKAASAVIPAEVMKRIRNTK